MTFSCFSTKQVSEMCNHFFGQVITIFLIIKKNLRLVSGNVFSEVIFDLLSMLNLTDHSCCASEDDFLELVDESEEIGVVGDSGTNFVVKTFTIIIGLVAVQEDGKTLRPDFEDPEANDVAFMKDEKFPASRNIDECLNAPADADTFGDDFIRRQQAEGKVTAQDLLHSLLVVIVIIRAETTA